MTPPRGHCQQLVLQAPTTPQKITSSARVSWSGQVPVVPAIGTTASLSQDTKTIVDVVKYSGLTPGQQYTVVGELMNADGTSTGLTKSQEFTPTAATGEVEVSFDVPAELAGKTVVVFEKLYLGTDVKVEPIAKHTEITDKGQTVTVPEAPTPVSPKIGTTATDKADGDKDVAATGGTIKDVVAYSGLTPGQEYTVSGVLMDKATGTAVGEPVTKSFTPQAASGTVDVMLPVTAAQAGKTLVVFESLFTGGTTTGTPVAEHKDLNDKAQTVTVGKPGTSNTGSLGGIFTGSLGGDGSSDGSSDNGSLGSLGSLGALPGGSLGSTTGTIPGGSLGSMGSLGGGALALGSLALGGIAIYTVISQYTHDCMITIPGLPAFPLPGCVPPPPAPVNQAPGPVTPNGRG